MQMIPVQQNQHNKQEMQQRLQPHQQPFGGHFQYQQMQNNRGAFVSMKPDSQQYSAIVQQNNNQMAAVQAPSGQLLINPQQKGAWANRPPDHVQVNQNSDSVQNNVYERVPPLHQHTPSPLVWSDDTSRKKSKLGKMVKKQ